MKALKMPTRPFTLALLGLFCLGVYPLFLQIPESSPFLWTPRTGGHVEACGIGKKCRGVDGAAASVEKRTESGLMGQESDKAELGAVSEEASGVRVPGLVNDEDRKPEQLKSARVEQNRGARSARQRSAARGKRVKENVVAEKQPAQEKMQPEDKTPRTPGGSIDEGDYEDLDAEELEDLQREKEAEKKADRCRCVNRNPVDCDSGTLNNRAVASVCALREDIKDLYRLHRWRSDMRANMTMSERFGVKDSEAESSAAEEGAGTAEDVSGEINVADSLAPKTQGKARPASFPPRKQTKPPTLAKQKEKMAMKLATDKVFRNKLVRKMRDSYGRRFLLPKPFDEFNDMLVDPQEYIDRDEEDGYITLLSVSVLAAIRETLTEQDEFRKPENMFYSKENQNKLRSKNDYFRNDSLPFLPEHSPTLKYKNCAVVGNSGALQDDEQGPVIDLHDLIIRTNQAPTFKYEKLVGSTTGMRILNKRWTDELGRRRINLLAHDSDDVTVIASRANIREFTYLARELKKAKPNARLLFLTSRVVTGALRFLRMFRKGVHAGMPRTIRGGNTASSGFLAIYLALQFCQRVHVYGFSLEECRSAGCSRDYHYFKGIADSPWLRAHPSHSFELEGMALKAMHVLGIACLFPNPSLTGVCGGRLGGLLDINGKWKQEQDLVVGLTHLGLSTAGSLRDTVDGFKKRQGAERARAKQELNSTLRDTAKE